MSVFSKRFTIEDRKKIEELLRLGFGTIEISQIIGFSTTAIKQEYKRGGGKDNYNADAAQKESLKRKQKVFGIAKIPIEDELLEAIKEKLFEGWSTRKIRDHFKMGAARCQRALRIINGEDSQITSRTFEERLSCLEMQVEILIQKIKELSNKK